MKKIVFIAFFAIACITTYSQGVSSALIESCELQTVDGNITFNINFTFESDFSFNQSPVAEVPDGWQISSLPALPAQVTASSSATIQVALTYPLNNLPYYPKELKFTFPFDGGELHAIAKIYFTPYNTIEVWDIGEFYAQPRIWQEAVEGETEPERTEIPREECESDVDFTTMTEAEIDAFWGEYQELEIEGLAYNVLRKKSLDKSAFNPQRYTFTVSGNLSADITNDLGGAVNIPMAGVQVRLIGYVIELKDFLFPISSVLKTEIGHTYTDANGNYAINIDEDIRCSGDDFSFQIQVVGETDDYGINARMSVWNVNSLGNKVRINSDKETVNEGTTGNPIVVDFDLSGNNGERRAIRAMHWACNGYRYFDEQGVDLQAGLTVVINNNYDGSFYWAPAKTLHISHTSVNENTVYHEFGHHTMKLLQGNNFTWPVGWDPEIFTHGWGRENTHKLAWAESWANFVQAVLDAAYWEEDDEYSWDGNASLEEKDDFNAIENGFRSEYYIATALYDLWDGPSNITGPLPSPSGFHEIPNSGGLHAWNDTRPGTTPTFLYNLRRSLFNTEHIYNLTDDVEFTFAEICAPLIEIANTIYEYEDIGAYYSQLISDKTIEDIVKINKIFRENDVLLNVQEYDNGIGIGTLSSDNLFTTIETEDFFEWKNRAIIATGILGGIPAALLIAIAADFPVIEMDVNYHNPLTTNIYSISPTVSNTNITDFLWIGSKNPTEIREASLLLNLQLVGSSSKNATFTLCGKTLIEVNDGSIVLGGDHTTTAKETTAKFIIEDGALLDIAAGQDLIINNNSEIVIKSGGTLIIRDNSNLIMGENTKITVENGGFLTIEDATVINAATSALIDLQSGYNYKYCNTAEWSHLTWGITMNLCDLNALVKISNTNALMLAGCIPTEPTWAEAPVYNGAGVQFSWTGDVSNTDIYKIYRSVSTANNFALLSSVDKSVNNYTDNSVIFDNIYYYKIAAKNDYTESSLVSGSIIISECKMYKGLILIILQHTKNEKDRFKDICSSIITVIQCKSIFTGNFSKSGKNCYKKLVGLICRQF